MVSKTIHQGSLCSFQSWFMQTLVARCPPTTLGLGERSRAMDPRHADWEININCLHLDTCGGLSGLERELHSI